MCFREAEIEKQETEGRELAKDEEEKAEALTAPDEGELINPDQPDSLHPPGPH